VSTEDIGGSVGISGPSVLQPFLAAKSDILVAAMLRGDEWLQMGYAPRIRSGNRMHVDGLNRLLGSYCAFILENPHLIQVLVSEAGHLPEPERHRTRAAQYAYIAEWVSLVARGAPAVGRGWLPGSEVQAVQTMMNDIALTPALSHPSRRRGRRWSLSALSFLRHRRRYEGQMITEDRVCLRWPCTPDVFPSRASGTPGSPCCTDSPTAPILGEVC